MIDRILGTSPIPYIFASFEADCLNVCPNSSDLRHSGNRYSNDRAITPVGVGIPTPVPTRVFVMRKETKESSCAEVVPTLVCDEAQ